MYILGISKLDCVLGFNLFDNPEMKSRKNELCENGIVRFQYQLNFDDIGKAGFYNPTRSGTAYIDVIVYTTDSQYLIQIQDITEGKKAEKEAVKATNDWKQTFDAVPDLVAVLDSTHHIVRANKAMADKLGLKPEECTDKVCYEIIHGMNKPPSFCPHKQLLEDRLEHTAKVHDDNLGGDFLVSASPLYGCDGKFEGSIHVARDITEYSAAEKEIRAKNALLEDINKIFREFWARETEDEAVEKCLETAEKLTGSSFSFLAEVVDNGCCTNLKLSLHAEKAFVDLNQKTKMFENMEVASHWEKTVKGGQSQVINTFHPDMSVDEGYPQITSFLGVPLKQGSKTIGMIGLCNKIEGYDLEDKENIELLSIVFGEALMRKRAELKLIETMGVLEELVEERTFQLEETYDVLKENEEIFRALAENSPDGIARISREFKYLYLNPAAAKQAKLFGEKSIMLEKQIKAVQNVFDTGKSDSIEFKCSSIKGIKYYQSIIVPEYNSKKKIETALVLTRDITNLRKVKNDLENEKKKAQMYLDVAGVLLVAINKDLDVTLVNRRVIESLGYREDEVIGKNFIDFAPFGNRTSLIDIVEGVLSGTISDLDYYEFPVLTKNGEERLMLWHVAIVRDEEGNFNSALLSGEDITERKKAEEKLRESEKYLKTILSTIQTGMVVIDAETREITDVNEIASKLIGASADEITGQICHNFICPSERNQCPVIDLEQGIDNSERILVTAYGEEIPIIKNVVPITLNGHKYFLESFIDITERKKAEEKLKETIGELERSNYELQQFAYITSHDLQEPLRTIASFTQLLERRYKGRLDSDADEFIEFIVDASIRMKEMIKGLLEYSRVGTQKVEFKVVNIDAELDQTLSNLHALIKDNKAEITHDPLPDVLGDPEQIVRIFQNLIGNAIKFKKQDAPPKIHIAVKRDLENEEYIFSVSDNGIGIEKEYRDKIFEVFKRLHAMGKYEGTGIGLSVVKRIIEQYNGKIWVESELGVGSTFYFTLPI